MKTAETDVRKTELLDKIKNEKAAVGIIGLGYVGLPLAIHFGISGFKILGFDLDPVKLEKLKRKESYIKHVSIEPVAEMISSNTFDVTGDFRRLNEVDCIIICVPTPLTDKMEPDLSYLVSTTGAIADNLRAGQLVVLESTTYPGTTEEMMLPCLESGELKVGEDFFLAYSPEREDPGNTKYDASNTPKIVGGVTERCLEAASALYSSITTTVPVSSTRAAEMTKLLENTFRSVNIALVNELKVLAHKMDIDLFEVIEAASSKPFGYTPFYPGPGLGGHCIPIDPFYLSWKAKEYDFSTRFIHLAGEINISMPSYVIQRTQEALNAVYKSLKGSQILILGIAYKKDVDDDRESPGYALMKMLIDRGAIVSYNDPWIPKLRPTRKYDFTMESVPIIPEYLREMDAVIIATDHSYYDYEEIVSHSRIIIDTRNATNNVNTGREKVVLA